MTCQVDTDKMNSIMFRKPLGFIGMRASGTSCRSVILSDEMNQVRNDRHKPVSSAGCEVGSESIVALERFESARNDGRSCRQCRETLRMEVELNGALSTIVHNPLDQQVDDPCPFLRVERIPGGVVPGIKREARRATDRPTGFAAFSAISPNH